MIGTLISLLITVNAISPISADNTVLTDSKLKDIFPDQNMRIVLKRYIHPKDMTINNIKNLKGEFYASSEKIKDLKGISLLQNVNNFVFWNNDIKQLPQEMKNLKNVKSINLANNYLIDEKVVKDLEKNGVKVDSDLNFIKNEDNQYYLKTKDKNLILNKNQVFDVKNILYKDVKDRYTKYWEVEKELPHNLQLNISCDSDIVKINGTSVVAQKSGSGILKVLLAENNQDLKQIVKIKITVR